MSPILEERIISAKAEKAINVKKPTAEVYIIKVRTGKKSYQKKYIADIIFNNKEKATAFAREFLEQNFGRKLGAILGSPELIELAQKYQDDEKPVCSGHCGSNYCDTNGCTERKRVLTNFAEITNE